MKALLAVLLVCAGLAQAEVTAPPGVDVLVLGEVHDNPAHHQEQARIVGQTQPTALVFEMIAPAQADAANQVDRADPAALAKALEWEARGWPDFAMYYPIFAAAPDAVIVGAALPGELAGEAIENGAVAAFGPEAGSFGLIPLPPALQAEQEAEQAAAHCGALPPEMLPGMVEVQRLRDAHFARVSLEALEAYGRRVVLITGSGHARTDIGAPAALRSARPDLAVWALGQFESDPGPEAPYDEVIVTEPVDRPDPCLAFQ
jgi:uncharacterized iron-regulated protein